MIFRCVPYFCGVIFKKNYFLFPKAWANIHKITYNYICFSSVFSCCSPISSRPQLVGTPMGPAFKFCSAAACRINSYRMSTCHVCCPCVPLIFHKSGFPLCFLGASCLTCKCLYAVLSE